MVRGAVGAAAGSLLLGSGYASGGNRAFAAVIADTRTTTTASSRSTSCLPRLA